MSPTLPRYAPTRPGERPDALFVEGAHALAISRIAEADSASPSAFAPMFPHSVAQFDAIESIAATVAEVERVAACVALVDVPGARRREEPEELRDARRAREQAHARSAKIAAGIEALRMK